jgi:mono/diheme cytochrome c family protein
VQVEATIAPGCVLARKEREKGDEPASPTYHRDVSRILQRNCVECHRKGGAGPFALDSLEGVRRKRAMIETVIQEGSMPPWFAAPGTGPWLKERVLTPEERGALLGWFAAGTPEGDASDAPQPRQWSDGWRIGEPDLVLSMSEPFQVPAEGVVDLQFSMTEATTADMWVRSIQILPEAVQVVHHVIVYIRMPGKPQEFFYGYIPGCDPLVYDDSVARFVPAGSRFKFDVHYTPNGVAASDRTRLGFVRARRPPDFEAYMRTVTNQDIFIPAGASNVSFDASFELPWRTMIRSLSPHMHARATGMRVEALRPDGTRELLILLDDWDANWQYYYDFREWRDYPKGTKLLATAWYDNSAANPDNPDPTVDVRYGPQTKDEMMLVGIEWVRPNRRPPIGDR